MQSTRQPAGSRRGYRPGLDGLRAIAVALVVAFHADWIPLSGGFVGVDVFFVLSGYLVTGILVDRLLTEGSVGFRRFYSRRVRRLLPLAVVVLVLSAIVFTARSSPVAVLEARGSFAAAFFYVANWWFIAESTEYLGSDIGENPILHFWSLAIEEQFYLVWPLVIAGIYKVASRFLNRPIRALIVLVAVLGTASLVAALTIGARDLNRAYYGTDTRAYQLLLGALLSLLPALVVARYRRLVAGAGMAALAAVVVLATDLLSLSAISRGAIAAAATALVILVLESDADTVVNRFLSLPLLTVIGRLSYGIYLWHLPVMFVLRDTWDLSSLELMGWASFVSLALSAISARLVEGPIRHGRKLDHHPVPVVLVGLATSLAGALLIIPAALNPSTSIALESATADGDDSARLEIDFEEVREDRGDSPDCQATNVELCTVVDGSGPHVLLVGDSHAKVWQSAFAPYAEATGFKLSVASVSRCSWHLDAMVAFAREGQEECYRQQHEWMDQIVPALSPDIVVLVHRATFDPARPFFANKDVFLDATDATVTQLLGDVPTVVILEPTPLTSPEADPVVCLSEGRPANQCGFDATVEPSVLVQRYREIAAENPAVFTLDFDQLACPRHPRCDVIVDDIVVFRDQSHMTATYAASLADQLVALDPVGSIADSTN